MNAMLLADITTDETFGGWALSNTTLIIVGGAPASEMLTLRPSAGAKHEPWTSCFWPSIVAFPRAATVLPVALGLGAAVGLSVPFSAKRTRPPMSRIVAHATATHNARFPTCCPLR